MLSRDVVVNIANDGGRKLAKLVSLASGYSSKIYVVYNGTRANAKSIMGVMNLVLYSGETVNVTADGDDEESALDAIARFFEK